MILSTAENIFYKGIGIFLQEAISSIYEELYAINTTKITLSVLKSWLLMKYIL